MVIDPIVYRGLVGSQPVSTRQTMSVQPYRNVASCPEGQEFVNGICVTIGTSPETSGFNWNKFSTTMSNVFTTLGNLFSNLTNSSNPNNMTAAQYQAYLLKQQQLNNTKILGMSATTGAVVITLVVVVVGYFGYKAIVKGGVKPAVAQ